MVCKTDVLQWFKQLESYKRIDTMCSLLIVCLPFELRFLGTCLEELGRRDSQELRGMELRANNPQDLAADMVTCQKGEPTDIKIRRKMALYLALIRACNNTCVAKIFETLECWGKLDFATMTDQDTLLELLLVYTMAGNHPVFSFHQQNKCWEIFSKIKENKLVADTPHTAQIPSNQQQQQLHPQHTVDHQIPQHIQSLPPTHQELMQQHGLHPMHQTGQHPQLMQMFPPVMFPQHLPKVVPNDGSLQTHQVNIEGIPPHMLSTNMTIPADNNAMIPHQNAWIRPYPPHGANVPTPTTAISSLTSLEQQQVPPQPSSSPMLSQQSSPSSSRTTSPNRTPNTGIIQQQLQQQQVRNIPQRMSGSLKNMRRPSAETTPPPMGTSIAQQQLHDMIIPQMVKCQMEDGNDSNAGNQLQNLIRNGYTRSGHHHRIKAGNYIPPHQQQQSPVSQQQSQHFQGGNYVNSGQVYTMQNINMCNDISGSSGIHSMDSSGVSGSLISINSNKSTTTGSDTGSSNGSSGDITPPETPTLITNSTGGNGGGSGGYHQKHHLSYNKQQIGLQQRLNGRNGIDKTFQTQPQQQPHQQQTQHQQQQQATYTGDMLMTTAIQQTTTLAQQHQQSNNSLVSIAATSNQQNMPTNTVLISTPSTAAGSPSVLLQAHQQPSAYNTAYPYHTAPHMTTTTRPPPPSVIGHNAPSMAQPAVIAHSASSMAQHGGFRFSMPTNGEMVYQTYHPTLGIVSATVGQPPAQLLTTAPQLQQVLRNTQNVGSTVVVNTNPSSVQGATTTPQQQQMPPSATQYTQHTHTVCPPSVSAPASSIVTGSSSGIVGSNCTSSVVGGPKNISCFNCGSQTHSGHDCQEASMEDVTRNSKYKLDYSAASASSAVSTNSSSALMQDNKMESSVTSVSVTATPAAVAASAGVILAQAVSVAPAGSGK